MKKFVFLCLFSMCSYSFGNMFYVQGEGQKVLHLSFHLGCIKDFEAVARELSLDLTSWYIKSPEACAYFDKEEPEGAVYNIGHERADRIWNKHESFFRQFDVIITSDTAPLSRIFLQHDWDKPLIIWICNRFDYCDRQSLDCHFPDPEYYELFRSAVPKKNVKIVSYTPYEYFHARSKGVDIGTFTIKPLGTLEEWKECSESFIPAGIDKRETFFIPPRLEQHQITFLTQRCTERSIKTYCGRYNGPNDLKGFKGIIHFPYAWSNLALFENIQNGLIHFVPSEKFIHELIAQGQSIRYFTRDHFELSEWYSQENKSLFVYFDSWDDLKEKIRTTNYEIMGENIKEFARCHRNTMLARWNEVFESFKYLN